MEYIVVSIKSACVYHAFADVEERAGRAVAHVQHTAACDRALATPAVLRHQRHLVR